MSRAGSHRRKTCHLSSVFWARELKHSFSRGRYCSCAKQLPQAVTRSCLCRRLNAKRTMKSLWLRNQYDFCTESPLRFGSFTTRWNHVLAHLQASRDSTSVCNAEHRFVVDGCRNYCTRLLLDQMVPVSSASICIDLSLSRLRLHFSAENSWDRFQTVSAGFITEAGAIPHHGQNQGEGLADWWLLGLMEIVWDCGLYRHMPGWEILLHCRSE